MRVLVACEESQEVCKAFRALGHEAYSCDIQECSGGHPEWHIKGDVLPILNGICEVWTMDGARHEIPDRWDLIIAHPPCTYLSCAGAERLFRRDGVVIDRDRLQKAEQAMAFFNCFLDAKCKKIAVENPVIMWKRFGMPKYSQIINPYEFGHPWYKRTFLWLRGLPELTPTNIVEPTGYWVQRSGLRAKGSKGGHRDPKMRAKTFPGIARAMAEQWGGDAREAEVRT